MGREILGSTPRMHGVVLLSFSLGLLSTVHQLCQEEVTGKLCVIPVNKARMAWELADLLELSLTTQV